MTSKEPFCPQSEGEIRTVKREKRVRLQTLGSLFLPRYLHPEMSSLEPPLSLTSHPAPPSSPIIKHGNTAWKQAPFPLVPLPFQDSHSAMVTGGMETLK